jgi:hypothetical protein
MKFNWDRIWIVVSTCEYGNEPSGSIRKNSAP